jgi:nucleoside-diphosphate-sugar epimerase
LITGSSGFIGQSLMNLYALNGVDVVGTTRNPNNLDDRTMFLDLSSDEPLPLSGFDTVVHLAAIAHKKQKLDSDFNEINFKATERFAAACADAGVRQFIYVSSIGVNGTHSEVAFTEADKPAPKGEYAISKLNAEIAIGCICEASNMSFIVIRPPLVYGPGAPGNISSLVKAMRMFIPIPFEWVKNRRHFCHLENLTSFIFECTTAKENKNICDQVFLICDDRSMSTPQFIRKVGEMHSNRPVLIRFPVSMLLMMLSAISQGLVDSLLLDLQISNEKAKKLTKWRPTC